MKSFLGIDPGVSGGFGIFGDCPEAHAFPKTKIECWKLLRDLRERCNIQFAVLEEVHAMPMERIDTITGKIIKQGATSIFTFGRSFGFLEGILIASGIKFQEVSPQTWQKIIGMKRVKGEGQPEWKLRLKERAEQLYPGLNVTRATADALILAYVARVLWMNKSAENYASENNRFNRRPVVEQLGLRACGMGQ
jgi:hypothetical protein